MTAKSSKFVFLTLNQDQKFKLAKKTLSKMAHISPLIWRKMAILAIIANTYLNRKKVQSFEWWMKKSLDTFLDRWSSVFNISTAKVLHT